LELDLGGDGDGETPEVDELKSGLDYMYVGLFNMNRAELSRFALG
jgi:hypothetical protein